MPRFYAYITKTPQESELIDEPQSEMGRDFCTKYVTDNDVQNVVDSCRVEWPNKSFKVYTYRSLYDPNTFKLVHRFDSSKS